MNIKKVGLTALAASLVSVSAHAGEMSVAGSASIGLKNTSKTASGKSWTMGNQLTFTGSGELDNGMNVALSFVLDQADDSTTGIANAPFDSHSVTVSSDALGKLVFSGEGGSSAQSTLDTTAAGDAWNNGLSITGPRSSESGNNSMLYTLPALVDGLSVQAGYSPGGAGGGSAISYGATYTGVEGLSVSYGMGETETIGSEQEHTTMKASYAYSSFTLSYSVNENNFNTDADGTDEEMVSWNVAYSITDDISVAYGIEELSTEDASVDEEVSKINVSYTSGGMTISASQFEASGVGNSTTETAVTGDKERWSLSASFAF